MEQIKLYTLLKYYFRYWFVVLAFILAGLGFGHMYNQRIQTPSYKSDATLLVDKVEEIETEQLPTQIKNYIELMTSRRVLEPVIKDLGLTISYEDLAQSVAASNKEDTSLIKLVVSQDNPETSYLITSNLVNSFKLQIQNLYGRDNIKVVDGASFASTPHNVRKKLQLITSGVAGFVLSIIILFFVYDYKLSNGTLDKEPRLFRNKLRLLKKLKNTPSLFARIKMGRAKKVSRTLAPANTAGLVAPSEPITPIPTVNQQVEPDPLQTAVNQIEEFIEHLAENEPAKPMLVRGKDGRFKKSGSKFTHFKNSLLGKNKKKRTKKSNRSSSKSRSTKKPTRRTSKKVTIKGRKKN